MLWTPTSSRWQQTQLKTIPSQRVIEWELQHTQSGFRDHTLLHGRFLRRRIWLKNNYLEAQIIFAPAKPKYEFRCLYLSNSWHALTSKDPTEDLRNCYIIFISYVATIYFYPVVSLKTADRCNLKTVFWKKAEINMSTDLPFDFVVSAILHFTEYTIQTRMIFVLFQRHVFSLTCLPMPSGLWFTRLFWKLNFSCI